MNEKMPIKIENLELPEDKYKSISIKTNSSSGYVNILSLLYILISIGSILLVLYIKIKAGD